MNADLNARAALFRALSHPVRLSLLRLTWEKSASGEQLARLMNLAPATVSHHLAQLVEVGLMNAKQDGHHRLHITNQAALDATLSALIRGDTPAPTSADPYRERVLRAFFKNGKLTTLPAQRKKKDVVLHELAQLFEPGRTYTEHEVNAILGDLYEDFFTLRRELVGLKVMARDNKGLYWRTAEASDQETNPIG